MPRKVFVDTSGWFALLDKDDRHHERAWKVFPDLLTRFDGLVTSNHVIGETYTLIRFSLGHEKAWGFMELLEGSKRLERLFTPENLEAQAFGILKKYADQDFSFVDATSFAWMESLKIRDAFAFDRHFSVFGFVRIPEA